MISPSSLSRLCFVGLLSSGVAFSFTALAQTAEQAKLPPGHERTEHFERDSVDHSYSLHYTHTAAEQNEVLTAVRNVLDPMTRIFLVPSANVIVVHGTPETQAQVASLLPSIDHPHGRYRITYTVSESDGSRKLGSQHFTLLLISGERGQIKQGSRVPSSTGNGQWNYYDVGMNFDATLTEVQGGGVLRSRVEQTSIAPSTSTPEISSPVIRNTLLEGTVSLVLGKSATVGSIDVPGSTRHFDIDVLIEALN